MKPRRWKAVLVLMPWLLVHGGSLAAYDLRTHGEITRRAVEVSEGMKGYLEAVGIRSTEVLDPGAITPPGQLARFDNTGTPRDWTVEGAIREDDFRPHPGCPPPLNPPSAIDRPLNHFFDVQRGGRGLAVLGLERGFPAPDWALGLQGRGPDDTQNRFSVLDARVYQLRSLTAPTRDERERSTALLFRTLGHVIHALEDMGQPQHTRNDPHAGCFQVIAGEHSWFEDYVETRARGIGFRARSLPSPPLLLDGSPPVGLQAYRDYWANPALSGLADFSSRNFLSAGTNLGRNCDGLPEPPCSPDAYGQRDVIVSALTVKGTILTGTVRLLNRRMRDPVTGATVTTRDPVTGRPTEDVAVASRSVWDQHLETRGFVPLFSMNTLNYDSISDVLLPRTVGYSAGLLDHFFRGKLDVDLLPADPEDPSVVRVSGANASTDALRGGTLTLYADDPTDPAGRRDPAAALDENLAVTADRGAPIESARFRVPGSAERFMAVYTGTLGQEVETGPFPGGVVGKVLGGVRVEEVFSDGTRWRLRTPQGVFLLQGLTTAEFEEVRWGDGDNLLVARTPFGLPDPNQPTPNRVVAYEVQRVSGSVELKTVTTPDGPEVQIREINAVDFPFGMPLGTAVEFSQTIQYRQRLARVALHRNLFQWVPRFPFGPQDGTYEFAGEVLGGLAVETAHAETVGFGERFSLALDLERHGVFGTVDRPYVWYVQEVAVDASGRLLAVVVVYLTSPQSPGTTLPYFGVNQQGGIEVISQVSLTPSFPSEVNPLVWAVVDLKARAVVASTADSVVTLSSQEVSAALPDVYVRGSFEFLGGPTPSVQEIPWNRSAFGLVDPSRPAAVAAELETRAGALAIGVTGWLKGELASLGTFDIQLGTLQRADEFAYDCGADATLNFFCRAVRVTDSTGVVARGPARLRDARRSRPAPGDERLVFITVGPEGEAVLVWDPGTRSARMVHRLPVEAESGHVLGPATGATVMVFAPERDSFLVPLDGNQPPAVFPVDLSSSFAVLDPSFLYHVQELKFYRPRPPLQPTALPARLADIPGNPVGDYHAIRLP